MKRILILFLLTLIPCLQAIAQIDASPVKARYKSYVYPFFSMASLDYDEALLKVPNKKTRVKQLIVSIAALPGNDTSKTNWLPEAKYTVQYNAKGRLIRIQNNAENNTSIQKRYYMQGGYIDTLLYVFDSSSVESSAQHKVITRYNKRGQPLARTELLGNFAEQPDFHIDNITKWTYSPGGRLRHKIYYYSDTLLGKGRQLVTDGYLQNLYGMGGQIRAIIQFDTIPSRYKRARLKMHCWRIFIGHRADKKNDWAGINKKFGDGRVLDIFFYHHGHADYHCHLLNNSNICFDSLQYGKKGRLMACCVIRRVTNREDIGFGLSKVYFNYSYNADGSMYSLEERLDEKAFSKVDNIEKRILYFNDKDMPVKEIGYSPQKNILYLKRFEYKYY